jgi:DNA-binding NtrC family response regulator
VTQNRILPLAGPVLTGYLLADAAASGLRWGPLRLGVAATTVLASLAPFTLRPSLPTADTLGRGRAGALGAVSGVALASQLGDGMPSMVAQCIGAAALALAGALLIDLALTVPDRPRLVGRLRGVSLLAALVAGAMGVAAPLPAIDLFGHLFLAPSAAFSQAPAAFAVAALVVATALRLLRPRLGSTPTALASNAWAVLGLAPALVVTVAVVAARRRGDLPEGSVWVTVAGAFVVAIVSYAHAALVDASRRLHAGRASRRGFAGALAFAAVAIAVFLLRREIPDDPLAMTAASAGLVAFAVLVFRGALPLSNRILAPFGGRLIEGCARAADSVAEGTRLEELAQHVLGAMRYAAAEPDASGRLYTVDPPTDAKIDAAGQPHVRARPMPETLARRFVEHPGEVVVLADLVEHVVRRPALRPLVEALEQLDALCAVPIMAEGELEGALVVPRGRRRSPLTLEEIDALGHLARRLSGPIRVYGALARAQARAGTASLEKDRVEEQVEALEDELVRLRAEAATLRAGRGAGPSAQKVVAYSRAARAMERRLEDLAAADASVALVAETGCFVDRIARRLHAGSARGGGPFVVGDCGYVAAEDTLAALVGRAGDAGATGWLRLAHGGTLLLVDVPALSMDAQRALAEALAVRQARPLDGAGAYPTDVRIVATSRVPLASLAAAGSFDAELARWLVHAELHVPPLRERPEDVPSLTLLAVDRACRVLGRPTVGIEQAAMDALLAHDWPGNLRELEVVIQRAAARAEGPQIRVLDLPPLGAAPVMAPAPAAAPEPSGSFSLDGTATEVEHRMLLRALERAEGNKSEAARLLGMKRTTFLDKLRRHELAAAEAGRPDAS